MTEAIRLASLHHPHPNPRVGAVLVDRAGTMVGSGAHERAGLAHAERLALAGAGSVPEGATMVVTLEPCDHHGRTPPCTDALIEAGVEHVVVGRLDPDTRVAGAGIDRLRAAGITVEVLDPDDPLAALIEASDPGYFHHRRTGRARVVLKLASTLDGQTAAADGTSQWITGEEARRDAHRLRARFDGVLVGSGTLIADDPRLDVRLEDSTAHQPRPIVVSGSRTLPDEARIWEREPIVVSAIERSIPSGELVVVEGSEGGVDLEDMLERLPELGILDLMVEGGATIAGGLWALDLVDAGVSYVGASIAGGRGQGMFDGAFETLTQARPVRILSVQQVGPDVRIDWEPLPVPRSGEDPTSG